MKKLVSASIVLTCLVSTFAFAGGKGGTEVALSSYGGLGVVASKGLPLNIEFLSSNGLYTYGEIELGIGFSEDIAFGAELAGGLLFGIAQGLSIYGSLGPAIGFGGDTEFGLGAEVGVNIDVNKSSIFIEAGTHPASNYIGVGLRF